MKKNLGVLMPVASLPGNHGIGDFGETSYRFIDWCSHNHYKYWQILPLNPLGPGESPYSSTCSFAIDDRYISLDMLVEMGLLDEAPTFLPKCEEIRYERVKNYKRKLLYKAYLRYMKGDQNGLKKFKTKHPWSMIFGTFSYFKEKNNDAPWNEWPKQERDYFLSHTKPPKQYLRKINFVIFCQYIAHKQWRRLLSYAREKGIKIIADMPFYVGYDSIDVWMNRDKFLLDENNNQLFEGGCPPDGFSDVGQKWGSPIYNFEELAKDNYQMMIDRTVFLANMCDILRLDHFRAFDTYYVIPYGMPDAKIGEWKIGPRTAFFDALYAQAPNIDLIAEDLGDLFPSVLELRDHYHLPGMFIEEFTIFDYNAVSNDNLIVYPGTHDNETLYGWYKNRTRDEIKFLKQRLNVQEDKDLYDAIVTYIMSVPSKMTIFALQDILKLDNKARLNSPGTVGYPNWVWKLRDWNWVKQVKIKNKY